MDLRWDIYYCKMGVRFTMLSHSFGNHYKRQIVCTRVFSLVLLCHSRREFLSSQPTADKKHFFIIFIYANATGPCLENKWIKQIIEISVDF